MRTTAETAGAPAKVAFWAGSFERAWTQQFLVELLARLDRRRFEPIVLSVLKTGELLPVIEELGVPVHEFRTGASLFAPATIRGLAGAASFLRREGVQILSCLLGIMTIFGPFVGRAAGVPVVVNNQRNLGYWLKGRTKKAVYGFANRAIVDAVLVNSEAAALELIDEFGVPGDKIIDVGVGIDLDRLSKADPNVAVARELELDGRPVIGIVAKLSPVKGHEHFLGAAREVARARDDARFLVIGDGPRRAELAGMAGALGIDDRVHFLGARSDVPSLLKLMDVFALSSVSEGSPNAAIEAMAAGLPVVGPRVGGLPRIVDDGRSGLLVEPGDARELGRAMLDLIEDPGRARAMGRRGRAIAEERYDVATVVGRVEDTFSKLLSRSRGASLTGRDRSGDRGAGRTQGDERER